MRADAGRWFTLAYTKKYTVERKINICLPVCSFLPDYFQITQDYT
jgi:hypothetical protein